MAERTEIAWCDSTFNPWIGCTKVGPGCDNCYAKADFDDRKHRVVWGAGQARSRTAPANWKKPEQWNKKPFSACVDLHPKGHSSIAMFPARRRVFCASLADVFDNEVPPEWRVDLFALIQATPNLDWLLLTKRIGNVRPMVEQAAETTVGTGALNLWLTQWAMVRTPPENVWLGASIVNQEEADRDIPKLLATQAAVRFLSMEPLLGPVDVRRFMWPVHGWWTGRHDSYEAALAAGAECGLKRQALVSAACVFLDWVIVGGESGPNARPMHPDWARSLRDQCAPAGVPFLFKQWGEYEPAAIVDDPKFSFGRAFDNPAGGRQAAVIRGGGAAFTPGEYRLMQPGETNGVGTMLDRDTIAVRVGKKAAGRLLDGVTHDGFPEVSNA
jgi:protein gp37